jgi:hypothetical protein
MERRALVSKDNWLSPQTQCDLLGISKPGLSYLPKDESDENLEIMKKMDKYYHHYPSYGVLQMQDYLFALGFLVNHKRVRRLVLNTKEITYNNLLKPIDYESVDVILKSEKEKALYLLSKTLNT